MPMGMASPTGGSFSGGARVVGATELTAEFLHRGAWAHQKSISIAIEAGKLLVEHAKMHSEGRPGPEYITGAYQDSFYYQVEDNGLTASVYAGSDEPFALRLEYGFVGADAAGRTFSQPPFPHWGPAADEVMPMYEAELLLLADFEVVTEGV